jgi:hypothetical protein
LPTTLATNKSSSFFPCRLSTSDRIGTGPIPKSAVSKFVTEIAKPTNAAKSDDSTQYPIAGNQVFLAFTSYNKNSPELASFGYPEAIIATSNVKIVVAKFRASTDARLLRCVFGRNPLKQSQGECDFAAIPLGSLEGLTAPRMVRTRPIYFRGGLSIRHEITY